MVVVDEVGVPLVRLPAEESVEALEPASQRPLPLRRGHVHLVFRRQMPLADGVGVPARATQDLGEVRALERNVTVRVGIAVGDLRDPRHAVRRVVPARHETGPGRRAQRRRVEVRERESRIGDPLDVRRRNQTSERLHRREADVVKDDVDDVGCSLRRRRLLERAPVRRRVLDVDVDPSREPLRHDRSLPSCGDVRQRRSTPAETPGFEPGRELSPPNRLAGGSFRPLRHVSVAESTVGRSAPR